MIDLEEEIMKIINSTERVEYLIEKTMQKADINSCKYKNLRASRRSLEKVIKYLQEAKYYIKKER